jgi:L-aspartate oxidase
MKIDKFDYIIVGCGLAGLYSALKASKYGTVALITKTTLELSNSYWAQGGITAAIGDGDSPDFHFNDTLKTGRDLCNKNAVKILVNEGRERILELIEMGMPFDQENGKISLGLEGGHSHRRVLHAGGDATGKEIVNFLKKIVIKNERIKIFENCFVYKLIVAENECLGISVYDFLNKKTFSLFASATIMASGGGSAIYSRSTNPHTTIGDGITLAYNAGAEIESMEFVQFHPTSFYSQTGETFLISEAVRGEGAFLVNHSNERFLSDSDITELAPRDVVSEAIFNEMNKTGMPNVFLKLDHLDAGKIKSRFSNIYAEALKFGIDITKDPVPVAPAAHYMIGGIKTGTSGETNIKRLFAVGEAASSGIHGANRLASNSLLECMVFAKRAIDFSISLSKNIHNYQVIENDFSIIDSNEKVFSDIKNHIAKSMWYNAGIARSKSSLELVIKELKDIYSKTNFVENEYYSDRIKSLILISNMIAVAALMREESRGCQLRTDFPAENPNMLATIILKKNNETKFLQIN